MKREYLELKTCRTEKTEFIRGKEYIVLGTTTEHTYEYECEIFPCYRVVNERGAMEIVVPEQIFYPTNRLLQCIKYVVYLGILDQDSLVEGEVYSVFKMAEEKEELIYTIFNDSNKLEAYSADLFITESDYLKMTKEEICDFKKVKEAEILKLEELRKKEAQRVLEEQLEFQNSKKKEAQKILDEQNRIENIKELNYLEIEKIKEFVKVLRPKVVENTPPAPPVIIETIKTTGEISKLVTLFIVGCFITLVTSITGSAIIVSIIDIIYLLGVFVYLYLSDKSTESFVEEPPERTKPDKEYIKLMVTFSDDILLKLKKIELNLLILESGTTISNVTVSLIRESVSFCLESYRTKDTNLLKDIDIFLDKTLEYIGTLIDGDNTEELFIEKQIYENVSSVINRNTDIFDLMISDNKKIKQILDKDRIFK